MQLQRFTRRTRIEAPAEFVFAWHERPAAFGRLTPPWNPVQVIERQGAIENGSRLVMRTRIAGLWRRWEALHSDYVPGRQFRDEQVSGPFACWKHTHRVIPDGPEACYLEDDIEYALPWGSLGRLGSGYARRTLERMFAYRHRVTRDDILTHWRVTKGRTMKIAITGATGLVGSALAQFLESGGHEVLPISRTRQPGAKKQLTWNPATGAIDSAALEGLDAVVHLAGENIGARWSAKRMKRIMDSRVEGTRLIAQTLAKLQRPPRVLVAASAIGYYGNRPGERLVESSPPGNLFVSKVCQAWEAETKPAADAGIRVVNTRFGIVLSGAGGPLAKMLPPFRFGLGGRVGSGKQVWSWVAIDDAIDAVNYALFHEDLAGPVNVVAPEAATNMEFTKILGRVLHRPTIFPMPAFAARLLLGKMADELLLADARVAPTKLEQSGYKFRFPALEPALRYLLGREK